MKTGAVDITGEEILLGMYVQNLKCKYLIYQVRIRKSKFILHTGSSYRYLDKEDAHNNLKIIESNNCSLLGLGAYLFNSDLLY